MRNDLPASGAGVKTTPGAADGPATRIRPLRGPFRLTPGWTWEAVEAHSQPVDKAKAHFMARWKAISGDSEPGGVIPDLLAQELCDYFSTRYVLTKMPKSGDAQLLDLMDPDLSGPTAVAQTINSETLTFMWSRFMVATVTRGDTVEKSIPVVRYWLDNRRGGNAGTRPPILAIPDGAARYAPNATWPFFRQGGRASSPIAINLFRPPQWFIHAQAAAERGEDMWDAENIEHVWEPYLSTLFDPEGVDYLSKSLGFKLARPDVCLPILLMEGVHPDGRPRFGMGRGILTQTIGAIFGMAHVTEIRSSDLDANSSQSQFNEFCAYPLVFWNEASPPASAGRMAGTRGRGRPAKSALERTAALLRGLIDLGEEKQIVVNQKMGRKRVALLSMQIIAATNYTGVLPVEEGERRIWVTRNADAVPRDLHAALASLRNDERFLWSVARWLLDRGFRTLSEAVEPPPMTRAKQDMVDDFRDDFRGEWVDIYEDALSDLSLWDTPYVTRPQLAAAMMLHGNSMDRRHLLGDGLRGPDLTLRAVTEDVLHAAYQKLARDGIVPVAAGGDRRLALAASRVAGQHGAISQKVVAKGREPVWLNPFWRAAGGDPGAFLRAEADYAQPAGAYGSSPVQTAARRRVTEAVDRTNAAMRQALHKAAKDIEEGREA